MRARTYPRGHPPRLLVHQQWLGRLVFYLWQVCHSAAVGKYREMPGHCREVQLFLAVRGGSKGSSQVIPVFLGCSTMEAGGYNSDNINEVVVGVGGS